MEERRFPLLPPPFPPRSFLWTSFYFWDQLLPPPQTFVALPLPCGEKSFPRMLIARDWRRPGSSYCCDFALVCRNVWFSFSRFVDDFLGTLPAEFPLFPGPLGQATGLFSRAIPPPPFSATLWRIVSMGSFSFPLRLRGCAPHRNIFPPHNLPVGFVSYPYLQETPLRFLYHLLFSPPLFVSSSLPGPPHWAFSIVHLRHRSLLMSGCVLFW